VTQVVPLRTRERDEAIARLRALVGVADDGKLTSPPGHALLAGPCRVHGCRRAGRVGNGLCAAHAELWDDGKHLEFEQWLATVAGGPLPCRVDGCYYGRSRRSLCAGHDRQWRGDHEADLNAWIMLASPDIGEHVCCLVRGCRLWASNWDGFCLAHSMRFHLSRGPHSQADLRPLGGTQLKALRRSEADAELLSRPVDEEFDQTASVAVSSFSRSTSLPRSNLAPARTRATRCGALTARQRCWAASISLKAIAMPAALEPGPLVTLVR